MSSESDVDVDGECNIERHVRAHNLIIVSHCDKSSFASVRLCELAGIDAGTGVDTDEAENGPPGSNPKILGSRVLSLDVRV